MKPISVLIIDDHTLFRSGIRLLLQRQDGFEVVGEAGDGLEGVKLAKRLEPDVVLLDLHMPGVGGLEALQLLQEELPQVQVVMLTVSEDAQDLLEALRIGARGYLLKNIETDFLFDAIRRAAAGESVMSPQMANRLADAVRAPQSNTKTSPVAARGGDHRHAGCRSQQQGNRPPAGTGGIYRQDPRPGHPAQAESEQPRAGGGLCRRARPDGKEMTRSGPEAADHPHLVRSN